MHSLQTGDFCMTQIRKAIIPAAGFGTRMLPAAKAVPKELLPVLDRPAIQYVVEEAAAAGAGDVLLITSAAKRGLMEHFRRNPELENRLRAGGKQDLLQSIDDLIARVNFHEVHQLQQLGLGDAVRCARDFAGQDAFICLLGDTVFSGDSPPAKQLAEAHARFGGTVIGVERVPPEKISRYGVVGGTLIDQEFIRIDKLIEKPAAAEAPSDLAIAARYILTPAIFDCLDRTAPGKGGEIQLTDALRLLLDREPIHGVVLQSRRHDIGNPIDWLKTNLVFAARDATMRAALGATIESFIDPRK
jgi:UTP--glucose-1-phosphate uridylyltransferase